MSSCASHSSGSLCGDHTCAQNSLIRRQFLKIEALEKELALLRLERDSLLAENERLVFQMQIQCISDETREAQSARTHITHKNENKEGATNTTNFNTECNKTLRQFEYKDNNQKKSSRIELSQQLLDKRVSVLERKYGGIQARIAAITIQKAFRTYRLQKRFHLIAIQAFNSSQKTTQNSLEKRFSAQSQPSPRPLVVNTSEHSNSNEDNKSTNSSVISDDSSHHSSRTTIGQSTSSGQLIHGSSSGLSHSHNGSISARALEQQYECQRKRQYRVGLNLFNKNPPERGVQYLITNGFIEASDSSDLEAMNVSRFLLLRKGISKQMIGEYIATLAPFNSLVLKHFAREIDLTRLSLDSALRKFQTYFRFPGEAQKIERLVESFADRYIECNSHEMISRDSVFILSFAIIMLNTDLHSKTLNSKTRMTSQQWLQNLRGVFTEDNSNHVLTEQYLLDIYQRIRDQELRTGPDHVTQVLKVQSAIVGKEVPNLCHPHRRLVCYCRLYEIRDLTKKETNSSGHKHQREVFLFNDLLLITKLTAKALKGQTAEYQYRISIALDGLSVQLFESPFHSYGIRLSRRLDEKQPLIMFNARNELDLKRFVDDLKESIAEMDEMESLRIIKSSSLLHLNRNQKSFDNIKDNNTSAAQHVINNDNNNALNNTCNVNNNNSKEVILVRRKSSSGSLDSGLSLPSRDHSPQQSSTAKQ